MENSRQPILIAYDGSEFAKAAIKQAAEQLVNSRSALVLTVWHPYTGGFMGAPIPPTVSEDLERDARRVAEEGARLAREEGLDAQPIAERGDPVWKRIVDSASEHDAGIVVMGSHGRSGIARVVMGSVADRVASQSELPVLIAHAPDTEDR
jgi:nucleotide-binding universal stress UspA family protein